MRNLFSILVCFFFLAQGKDIEAQNLRVVTFNIRYDNPADGPDAWTERKTEVARLLQSYEFSVIGLQEVLHHQLLFLDSALTEFDFVGVGRDDGKQAGEYAPIFYQTNELELLNSGHFWLSSTPGIPSTGWDAALPRICTWCRLRIKLLGIEFVVLNTHFDHKGILARENAAKLILEKMKELSDNEKLPVVLLGDFNAGFDEPALISLCNQMQNAYQTSLTFLDSAAPPSMEERVKADEIVPSTFNGFDRNYPSGKMIDHIFTKDCDMMHFMLIDELRMNGRHLSDHFAVMALLQLHLQSKRH